MDNKPVKPFYKSKFFLYQIIISVFVFIIIVNVALFSVKNYTNHGEKITVPNLKGKNIEQVESILKPLLLRYTVYDSIYNPDFKPGEVVTQIPSSKSIVKSNRNINLIINSKYPKDVVFPDITDNSLRQAYERLITSGFNINKLIYVENNFLNLVLYAKYKNDSISAGKLIKQGSNIDLVVGIGNKSKINIPNLFKEDKNQAIETLLSSGFNIGKIEYDESVKTKQDRTKAKIYKQTPHYNEDIKLTPGSKISIKLSLDSTKLKIQPKFIESNDEDNQENED
ncbi:MAG: PASTA domain-containing protein [Marinifilaceae bacterium]|jgi:beta-lactam-binding protein with PASTA domain|nr:PASTA domain-containing protein [Marinifilaceae bacterium]